MNHEDHEELKGHEGSELTLGVPAVVRDLLDGRVATVPVNLAWPRQDRRVRLSPFVAFEFFVTFVVKFFSRLDGRPGPIRWAGGARW